MNETSQNTTRLSTGIPALDQRLGGGLLPGTLSVIVGATGIGKTQLGIQFARAGQAVEPRGGVLFDMSARGDSQNHQAYAHRICGWELEARVGQQQFAALRVLEDDFDPGDYLHVFQYVGQRVTRDDLDWEQWHTWQAELNSKLQHAIGFLYANMVRGCQRVVVDGIEPVDRASQSIQMNLFEYVYHQILRKDPQWVARDLFREHYRQYAEAAARRAYDPQQVSCLLLATSHEIMLDDLISRPIEQGDVLSNANTVILMGKTRDGNRMGRALYVAKHRGSGLSEEITPYRIDDGGIVID